MDDGPSAIEDLNARIESRDSEAAVAVIEESQAARVPQAAERAAVGAKLWLDTEHWLLMTVTPAYAPLYARLHERNGDHFRMAMSLLPEMSQPTFWAPVLQRQQRATEDGTGLFLAGFHKEHGRTEIGCSISFSGIVHDEFETCWLGYRLDRRLEGRGLMHAALAPAIAAVFERYKLHRIMASHQPDNLRSGKLLRRLGFGIDGYARDFIRVNGRWHDNVLVSLIEPGA
jgi:ribosomal-protein-alanine N-acetyltransferase